MEEGSKAHINTGETMQCVASFQFIRHQPSRGETVPRSTAAMDLLKGSGSTFSTSGKRWNPFRGNRRIGAQNAKRHRIVAAGLAGLSKDDMRDLATKAAQSSPVRRIATGKRAAVRCDKP